MLVVGQNPTSVQQIAEELGCGLNGKTSSAYAMKTLPKALKHPEPRR
jgi:hypothetical protein